jgi:TolA-binding protein
MRRSDANSELSGAAERLVRLSREELGEMSPGLKAGGLLELNGRRISRTRSKRRVLGFAAALCVVALAFAGHYWFLVRQTAALSYAVEGGQVDSNGAVAATPGAEPVLRFSDGTEVAFLAGSRGRVKSVAEHGARISVTGKVRVAVVHWRGSHWLFDAGPFLITVTGTTFIADWQERDGRLEVDLETGSIAVSGPLSDEAIALRAGQRLVISTRDKEVVIRDIDPARGAVALPITSGPESVAPAATDQAPAPAAAVAGSAPAALASSWSVELAAGRFFTILQQAEQRGLDRVLSEASSDDLAALADAARYSRRDDVARRALSSQRTRFPQSGRASDAAFLLGRLEETAQRSEQALAWYERCLSESRHGTYVSEALGRKMKVLQRLHGAARARPVAEEYVRRFPEGTYAAAARALLRAP